MPRPTSPPTPNWQVITLDLATVTPDFPAGSPRWGERAQWQGLEIHPTVLGEGRFFAVDWVRLTDCNGAAQPISFAPTNGDTLWVKPLGIDRKLRVATGIFGGGGSATLNTDGLASGTYQYAVGERTTPPADGAFVGAITVNQAPHGRINLAQSGSDYAASRGNPWDFNDPVDANVITFVPNTSAPSSYGNGLLTITTPSGPLPAGINVAMIMNTPSPFNAADYRYLTIRMNTGWKVPWENIPHGMIARWIWQIQGTSGRQGFLCTLVGPDIPYNVGNQTIVVDLYGEAGRVEEHQGECPANVSSLTWQTSGTILGTRFDPNENVTGQPGVFNISGAGDFTQILDEIKLTTEPSVAAGQGFPLVAELNEQLSRAGVAFCYSPSRSAGDCTPIAGGSNAAQGGAQPSGARLAQPNELFLPLIVAPDTGPKVIGNNVTITWNTAGVAPGRYYPCLNYTDGLNAGFTCSNVPVIVR